MLLLDGCDVLDGDFYAIDRGENRSAHFLERLAEILDLTERPHEQFVKLLSERRVVRRNCGQDSGVIERRIEPLFQLAHAPDHARVDQRIEIAKAIDFFNKRVEAAQQLHVFFGKRRDIGVG